MPDNTIRTIDCDTLHAKSKVYISRALTRKVNDDFDEYQLWASLALELLGKAALASKHPSLVVDPTHRDSMFVAAGINVTTDVKTITAKTVFDRLGVIAPGFDKNVRQFCQNLAQRRNAELHSADLPFRAVSLSTLTSWEKRYWYACNIILQQMNSSLEHWLGASEATTPRQLLLEAVKALEASVERRVEVAKEWFFKLKKSERKDRVSTAAGLPAWHLLNLFKSTYDEIWSTTCPSCEHNAFMTGNQTGEEFIEADYDPELGPWSLVGREFAGEEFSCPICNLSLDGINEIEAAGLDWHYEDQQEQEMEYEPEYGNE